MPTLYYTVGLPASGKTTYARELVKKNPGMVRANRDDLRLLLHEGRFSKGNEKTVSLVQETMIRAALAAGRDVICDDTNLNPKTQARLRRHAEDHEADVEVIDFTHVSLIECIERDNKRDKHVGETVIRRMWEQYLKPPTLPHNGNPECVVIDMDGTLALMAGRSAYDWARVGEDLPNKMVVEYARYSRLPVVVLSGRDGSCRQETLDWLDHHDIGQAELLMRKAGDMRKDYIIKNELLDDLLERWYPVLAIDDRQQVVDGVWRARGIECWQVAAGRF